MQLPVFPPKLKAGDGIRILAPSCTLPTLPWLTDAFLDKAKAHFTSRGFTVTEAKHLRDIDMLGTASVEARLADLHDAFRDPAVQCIITIRGGWNANQLLSGIDYDLLRANPKILCGFSDITALSNAIFAKAGLVTYSGPNFYHFALGEQIRYSFDAFEACVVNDRPIALTASPRWTNDRFAPDHQDLLFEPNEGWWMLQEGQAEGMLLGANLCTLNLLQGTPYMPDIRGSVLFIEDDHESPARTFDRNLQSLIHVPAFADVRGIVIGRFEKASEMSRELLVYIIKTKPQLAKLPIIANVDFGHTHPIITFPIGGTVRMVARPRESAVTILLH